MDIYVVGEKDLIAISCRTFRENTMVPFPWFSIIMGKVFRLRLTATEIDGNLPKEHSAKYPNIKIRRSAL